MVVLKLCLYTFRGDNLVIGCGCSEAVFKSRSGSAFNSGGKRSLASYEAKEVVKRDKKKQTIYRMEDWGCLPWCCQRGLSSEFVSG
jgi:hypothetical protein